MRRLRELVYGAPPITDEVLAWPLKVLVLAEQPWADPDVWIDRRPTTMLRPGPQQGWPDGARYCPEVTGLDAPFAKVQTFLLPCRAEELEEDFEEGLPPDKSSLVALADRPGERVLPRYPYGLLVLDLPWLASAAQLEHLASIATVIGTPILHRGPAAPPWVFSGVERAEGALRSYAERGWVGEQDEALAWAVLASRIARWGAHVTDWRRGDLAQSVRDAAPEGRFTWLEDDGKEQPVLSSLVVRELAFGWRASMELELEASLGAGVERRTFPFAMRHEGGPAGGARPLEEARAPRPEVRAIAGPPGAAT